MEQYKIIIIYAISDDERKKSFEDELEKYGLERLGDLMHLLNERDLRL